MADTIQIIFAPVRTGTYNDRLKVELNGDTYTLDLEGECSNVYKKSLRPFKKHLIPEYIDKMHPKYIQFIDEFFSFLEQKSLIDYFSEDEESYSLYQNIIHILMFGNITSIPTEHIELFDSFFNDYASTYNFTNLSLDIDSERLRDLCKNSNLINRLKCTWKVYNFYTAAVNEYLVNDEIQNVKLKAYFINSTDNTLPPDETTIRTNDDEIILSELPVYTVNESMAVNQDASILSSPDDYKGVNPFRYQIISSSDIFTSGVFVQHLIENGNPAGFDAEIIYLPIERTAELRIAGMTFPKAVIDLENISGQ